MNIDENHPVAHHYVDLEIIDLEKTRTNRARNESND